jgi:hypothetical protein
MELEKNNRGFYNGNFTDLYGEICSIVSNFNEKQ